MAPTLDYLRALRRRQLGEDVPDLLELERAARAANSEATERVRQTTPATRLHLGSHARKRMAQRGLRIADVYAIYLHGEGVPDRCHAGRTRYRITERALEHVDGHVARRLRRLAGDVIVVAAPNAGGPLPAVITVLPFGDRTR